MFGLAQFLDEFPPDGGRAPGESDEVVAAVGDWDWIRCSVPVIDQLL